MSAAVHTLVTDPQALWQAWIDARIAHMDRPTPASLDRCLEAFRPYYIKLVGNGWQDTIDAALAEEMRRCNAFLIAARRRG